MNYILNEQLYRFDKIITPLSSNHIISSQFIVIFYVTGIYSLLLSESNMVISILLLLFSANVNVFLGNCKSQILSFLLLHFTSLKKKKCCAICVIKKALLWASMHC